MIKKRSEVKEEDKWDLTKIYKSDVDIKKDIDLVNDNLETIKIYENKLLESPKTLLSYIEFSDDLKRKIEKLYTYASLKNDEDLANNKSQELKEIISNINNKYNELTSFVVPELLEADYQIIEEFYKKEPKLLNYEKNLKDIYKYKDHTLSKEEEKLLSILSKNLFSSSNIYSLLTDSDMTYDSIKDSDNNLVELNESNYSIYIKDNNRRVRKDAYNSLYKGYKQYINTISKTLSSFVESLVKLSKIYHYNNSLEEALFDDAINPEIYHNLIKTVNNNLEPLQDYYRFKKEILKLDEMYFYDIYKDVIEESNKKYSFSDAKDIVLKALSVMGEDYTDILNKAFNEKWIDKYNNRGKRGGAYSSGCYDTAPYVLLNYEGTLEDVSTLAHELGHSVHSYYSRHNNPYHIADYKIFVAEVASTVNELLLAKYLLKNSTNDIEKLSILNRLLELYKGTLYRQTMFAEFELFLYEETEKGNVLTSDKLNDKYRKLNEKYFKDSVVVDDEIIYEWAKVPHFYYDFYVYKYALGISAATYIAKNIEKNDEKFIEKYKKFLKTGGSMDPLDELKIAGVDLSSKEIIEESASEFKNILEEFKELYNRVYKR